MPPDDRPPFTPAEMAKWEVVDSSNAQEARGGKMPLGSRFRTLEWINPRGDAIRYFVSFDHWCWRDMAGFHFQCRTGDNDNDYHDTNQVPVGVMWHAIALLKEALADQPAPEQPIPRGVFGPESVKNDDGHIEMTVRVNLETDDAVEQIEAMAQRFGTERREAADPEGVVSVHTWRVTPDEAEEDAPLDCANCGRQQECRECPGLDRDGQCEAWVTV